VQCISPVAPDHMGILAVTEVSDVIIAVNRLLVRKLNKDGRQDSGSEDDYKVDDSSAGAFHGKCQIR